MKAIHIVSTFCVHNVFTQQPTKGLFFCIIEMFLFFIVFFLFTVTALLPQGLFFVILYLQLNLVINTTALFEL
jgi:hypothetical protein